MTNLVKLKKSGKIYPAALEESIKQVESNFEHKLPSEYRNFLLVTNGIYLNSGFKIYSIDELVERNETYAVKEFAENYLMIGDNSGGKGIVVFWDNNSSPIFCVDMGFIHPNYMQKNADSFDKWINADCSIDDEGDDE